MAVVEEDKVVLSLKEYEELIDDSKFLRALIMAGVDNWEGHDYAVDLYNEGEED